MTTNGNDTQITHDDVVRLVSDLGELKIARIVETGGSLGDLEAACALVAGDAETARDRPADLAGVVAEIYDILTIDEALEEDR